MAQLDTLARTGIVAIDMPVTADIATNDERKPKNRLTEMLTIAVGLVDRAANERTFLVVKRDANMSGTATPDTKIKKEEAEAPPPAAPAPTDAPAPEPPKEEQKAIKLPAAAKQALADGFIAIFQKLAPVAELINGAEVDDTASVPAEIVSAIEEAADALDTLAEGVASPTMVEQSATPPAATAPPVEGETTTKAAVRKAGRRIAKGRLEQLQGAHELHGKAHDLMGSLLKDLTGGAAPTPPAPPAAPAPATKAADEVDVAKAVEAAVAKALAPVLGPLSEAVRTVQTTKAFEQMAKAVRAPQAQANEAPVTTPKTATVSWPSDLAAEVAAERKARRK